MVSPVTLVFNNVHSLEFDIYSWNLSFDIDKLLRSNPKTPKNVESIGIDSIEYDWVINLQQGEITFNSIGFTKYIRKEPILLDRQNIGLLERCGINLNIPLLS